MTSPSNEKDGAMLQLQLQQGRASLQEAATLGANLHSMVASPGTAPVSATVQTQHATAQDRRLFRSIEKPGYLPEGPLPGAFSQPVELQEAAVALAAPPPPTEDSSTNLADIEQNEKEQRKSAEGPTRWWQKIPLLKDTDKDTFYVSIATILASIALVVALSFLFLCRREPKSADTPPPTNRYYTSSAPSPAPSLSPAPTNSPSNAPSWDISAFKETIQLLLPNQTLQTIQNDPNSPQAKALEFSGLDLLLNPEFPDWRHLQRFALATLYYAMGGDQWTEDTNWLDHGTSECLWYYHSLVAGTQGSASACYPNVKENTYKRLRLWENNLVGTLPPELFVFLTNLEHVDFRGNSLTGPLPSEIGLLSRLESLQMNQNQLTGSIPSELGGLAESQILSLSQNKLQSSIPSELGLLHKLEFLDLNNNQLTGTVTLFKYLGQLKEMDVTNNTLSGEIDDQWCGRIEFDCDSSLCGCSCACAYELQLSRNFPG